MTDPGLFGVIGEGEPAAEGDLLVAVDPAARYSDPDERRRAFEAWVDAGRPWPPEPPGMVSAIAGAVIGGRR